MSSAWRGLTLALGVWGLAFGLATGAAAEARVKLEVTVAHVSDAPGGVQGGARGQRVAKIIPKEIRYQSLEVVEARQPSVAVNEVWKLGLPTGQPLVVRPLGVNDQGALVAIDLGTSARGDFRLRSGKPVVLIESHGDGKLVILLEAQ